MDKEEENINNKKSNSIKDIIFRQELVSLTPKCDFKCAIICNIVLIIIFFILGILIIAYTYKTKEVTIDYTDW